MPVTRLAAAQEPAEMWASLFPGSDNSSPLFKSSKDLAREICADPANPFKDSSSALASLSPVIRCKKTCRPDLIRLITGAIGRRAAAKKLELEPETLETVERLLSETVSEMAFRCEKLDFATLLQQTKTCQSFVAIAPPGALSDPCGREVFNVVVKRLQSLEANGSSSERFWIMADHHEARRFWRELLLAWTQTLEISYQEALDQIERLESSGQVIVFAVPEESCLFPAFILDPHDPGKTNGFHLESVSAHAISICRMSAETLNRWRSTVYARLSIERFGEKMRPSEALKLAGQDSHS